MKAFKFYFTAIDRDTEEILCENVSNVSDLKEYLRDAMYDYVYDKVVTGSLGAKRLT